MKKTINKIKYYAPSVDIVNNDNLEKRILNFLLFSLVALAILYVIILGNTVFNIVARQSLSSQSKNLSNEVSDLELRYLLLSDKVDLAMSSDMGFKESKVNFATRKSLGSLSMSQNEF